MAAKPPAGPPSEPSKPKRKPRNGAWRQPFLAALQVRPVLAVAAAVAGVNRDTVRKARSRSPRFDGQVLKALKIGTDRMVEDLEMQAYTRATGGSDRMLEFMLKHWAPERYGEKLTIDITAKIRQMAIEAGLDPDEQVAAAERIIAAAKLEG